MIVGENLSGAAARRRVVITGMGAIACIGDNANECWEAMREGRSGLLPLSHSKLAGEHPVIAGEIRNFRPPVHFDHRRLAVLDRVSQLALVAAREAAAQSALPWSAGGELNERSAVVIGTGGGGEASRDEQCQRLYGANSARAHPLAILRAMANAPAAQITIEFGLTGPAFAITSACASSNHAIAQAFHMVRDGYADSAIAGGTEACLTFSMIKSWEAMRVMSSDTCRPFCAQRRGMVLAEGAGMFVLEPLESARRRGAAVLAEIAGCGFSADAADLAFPSELGASQAMTRALLDASLNSSQIDYISAHGTGTRANDVIETRAIRLALGAQAERVSISSTKSVHGHALGAAGALELIAVIQALRTGIIPPTANFLEADPQCDLDITPNVARERRVDAALTNSFAFGGMNAVIALRQAA